MACTLKHLHFKAGPGRARSWYIDSVSSCLYELHSETVAKSKCLSQYSGLSEVLFLFTQNGHWPNAVNKNTLQLTQELFQVLRKRHFN